MTDQPDVAASTAIGTELDTELLKRLVQSLLIACVFVTLVLAATLPRGPRTLVPLALFAVGCVAVWIVQRLGHPRVAAVMLVTGPFALIAASAAADGGVRSTAFAATFVVVMLAGIILGWRASAVMSGAAGLLGAALVAAESAGVYVNPVQSSSVSYYAVYMVGLVMSAAILGVSMRATSSALSRLREKEAQLAAHNRTLEETVGESDSQREALQRALRAFQLLSDCNRRIVHAEWETDLIHDVCRLLAQDERYDVAWIAFPDDDDAGHLRIATAAGRSPKGLTGCEAIRSADTDNSAPCTRAWREREITVLNDIAADTGNPEWRDAALAQGLGSCIILPLVSGEGRIGLLAIFSALTECFDTEEIGLLRELADDVAFGLSSLRSRVAAREREKMIWRSEERLRQATLVSQLGIFENDHQEGTVYWSPELRDIHGFDADEAESMLRFVESIHPDDRELFVDSMRQAHDPSGDGCLEVEARVLRENGEIRWVTTRAMTFFDENDANPNPSRTVGAVLDITERKEAGRRIERQLQRLHALNTIDRAISGSLNLRLTLDVIIDQVVASLQPDAAAVLMLDADSYELEYAHGTGFRSSDLSQVRVPLGQGPVGTAALEQRTICVTDPAGQAVAPGRGTLLAEEGFCTHTITPLVVKGQTKGVLEVFHRRPFEPDDDWTGFFEALALQTAIALDSAAMFEDLERRNIELSQAYDATIEGWSRALDLRDRETEGHTRRVTDMTVRLARAMGLEGREIVHIRRGALLHDIGKMGVRDAILHKPGPLTEEEWAEMRRHPQLAFEMLAPISHLRPALDIPACHHERWDGSGYPRGLKGDLIPLAARIFAVVDVWDALSSDRPYRSRWTPEKVREHIEAGSGTHFDPKVVSAFLRMLDA